MEQARAAKGFAVLSLLFALIFVPVERLATREASLVRERCCILCDACNKVFANAIAHSQHPRSFASGISAREQLRRRGSF